MTTPHFPPDQRTRLEDNGIDVDILEDVWDTSFPPTTPMIPLALTGDTPAALGVTACQGCGAVVMWGARAAHVIWHGVVAQRVAETIRRTDALTADVVADAAGSLDAFLDQLRNPGGAA